MGKSCSCLSKLPPEHSYGKNLLSPSSKQRLNSKSTSNPYSLSKHKQKSKPLLNTNTDRSINNTSSAITNIASTAIHPHQQQQQAPNPPIPVAITTTQNDNGRPRLSKPSTSDTTDSTKLLSITTRVNTTNTNNNNNNNNNGGNDTYRRVNTSSTSFMGFNIDESFDLQDLQDGQFPYNEDDDESFICKELKFHCKITIGYITSETDKYENINVPLCIIDICRQYYFALQPLRRKRVIFTSIVQLNLCIDKIPQYILDESIFFFKVNTANELISFINSKKEGTDLDDYENDEEDGDMDMDMDIDQKMEDSMASRTEISTTNSLSFIKDLQPLFIQYLRQKLDDNLLLLMDNKTSWSDISKQLSSVHDIWYNDSNHNNKQYNELLLDKSYWNKMDEIGTYQYNVDSCDVLEEIEYASLKYSPSMEILWQSNPTCIPMKIFDVKQYHLQNGYNTDYIRNNTKSRGTMHLDKLPIINSPECMTCDTISTPTTYLNGNCMSNSCISRASNADLVILSMYNSGNDFSEIEQSKTSYCYDQSYTVNNNNDNDDDNIHIPNIDLAIMNCNNLFININNDNFNNNQSMDNNNKIHPYSHPGPGSYANL